LRFLGACGPQEGLLRTRSFLTTVKMSCICPLT